MKALVSALMLMWMYHKYGRTRAEEIVKGTFDILDKNFKG